MKNFVIAGFASALLATSAFAADEGRKIVVKTGYEVPGCLNYRLVDGKPVQDCDKKSVKNVLEGQVDPTSPFAGTGSGIGGGSGTNSSGTD